MDQQTNETQSGRFRILELLALLWPSKWLIASTTLIAAAIAAGVALLIPNEYTAVAKILPPTQSQTPSGAIAAQLAGLGLLSGTTARPRALSETYVAMLKSRTLADSLVDRFNLKSYYRTELSETTRTALAEDTRIVPTRDGVITVEYTHRDPKVAAAIANAYVEELDRLTQNVALTEAGQRRLFFERQLKSARAELETAESRFRAMQEKTGLIKLEEQGRAIIESVANLRAAIAVKEIELSAISSYATAQNPSVIRARNELVAMKSELAKLERDRRVDGDILLPTANVPAAGLEYMRHFRELRYNEGLYEALAKQYEMARIDEARDSGIVQVLDNAVVPERKSRPHRSRIVLQVTFAALVMAIAAALWLQRRRTLRRT